MLIFDNFPNRERAEAFAKAVKDQFGLEVVVCDTEAQAREYDVFPFRVDPPIVMVERPIYKQNDWLAQEQEETIEQLVTSYGGTFAGT